MTMSNNNNNNNNVVNGNNQFGDTTMTKVFVGGLAWETPKEAMKEHFDKYGEILEAVVISDKVTGRSKGYGFVTFKDPEAAKKACEDATPVINGRRANCNLASLGARRQKPSSPVAAAAAVAAPAPTTLLPPLHHQGSNVVGLRTIPTTATAPNPQVQWYYPAGTTPLPYHHHHHQAIPFFGYSPTYIAADITYNHKLSYNGGGGGGGGGGTYMNGHYTHHHHHQMYPSQAMLHANTLVPVYSHHHQHHPLYQPYHHTTMGLPAHIFPTTTTASGPIATVPVTIQSKPALISPPPPPPPPTNSDKGKPQRAGRRTYTRRRDAEVSDPLPEEPVGYVDPNSRAELVLTFPDPKFIPSKVNLNNTFKRFGTLNELQTELDRDGNRARVVFKKCSDAEVACNSASKFNIFGSLVVNYQLNYTLSEPFTTYYKPVTLPEAP